MNSLVNSVEGVGVLEQIEQVEGPPAMHDFLLECLQRLWLWQRIQRRHSDPRLAAPSRDPHAAVTRDGTVEGAQCDAEAVLKVGDECAGVLRLAQRRVVHVAVVFEVGGQVVFGIAPAVGADDGDLAAADRVSDLDS